MLNEAALFLLDVLVQPFAAILLARFLLQWLRAPLRNPAGDFCMVLTNFVVLPVRRFVPPIKGMDSASLLLAFLVELVYLTCLKSLLGVPLHGFPLPGLIVLTIVKLLKTSVYLLMGAIIFQAILSWINPQSPFTSVLHAITGRFLAPFRRFVPMAGSIDLSPLALLIVCQLIVIVPIGVLEVFADRLL